MNKLGLQLACRYAFPPNRLHLCGPERQQNIEAYTKTGTVDAGAKELLTQFSTFYPYLQLIAAANHIKDPFDPRVVEAYWIGNSLLSQIKNTEYINHLDDTLGLKKKLTRKNREQLYTQISTLPLPHHNFHVCAIWQRTGNISAPHSIESMDACIINCGTIESILDNVAIVRTQALTYINHKLTFGPVVTRKLLHMPHQAETRALAPQTTDYVPGSIVSYHWGVICDILTPQQQQRLQYYTNIVLSLINT